MVASMQYSLLKTNGNRLGFVLTALSLYLTSAIHPLPAVAQQMPVAVPNSTLKALPASGESQLIKPSETPKTGKASNVTLQTETRIVTMAPATASSPPTDAIRFTDTELRNIVENKYSAFADDPLFTQRLTFINNDRVDFPTREFITNAFDDEQKSFISQRHKDLALFLENYLVKNNLPNMTDVTEFVDKIENKYFYFEDKTFGSSNASDKNYYRTLLETQVVMNEPAFNKFVRDYIKDAEIKRKKYFSGKVNDYFYEMHFKEGVNYDKTLQDLVTNNLIEAFSSDTGYSAKYCPLIYEKFFTDKTLLSNTYNNAANVSIDAFKKRLTQNIIPTFIKLQAGGSQVLTHEDYDQFSSQLIASLGTPAFVFANRNTSDTDIVSKLNANFPVSQQADGTITTAKSCLQGYFAHSKKQVIQASIAAVQSTLTQDNWDRAISAFIKTSDSDPTIAETLHKAIIQEFYRQNKASTMPYVVELPAQLEGADGPKVVSALKDDIKSLFDSWDVEAFRAPLQSDLLKEVFFPAKDLFVGNTPEAKARFQLLSFLTMYSVYYSNTPDANKRLETLLATPIKQHRQAIFENTANRKLAVREFRKMIRSNEGGIIAKATLNELVVASALAASIYTNPTNTPKAAALIIQSASMAVPSIAKLTSATATSWQGLMSQIVLVFAQKGTAAILPGSQSSQPAQTPPVAPKASTTTTTTSPTPTSTN